MNKRKLGSFALCAVLFALCFSAEAQQASKAYLIGFLSTNPLETHAWDALLDGLRERGYIEGRKPLDLSFCVRPNQARGHHFAEAESPVRLRSAE
jgi:hypothetical protein